MKAAVKDLIARRSVWPTLSELYLDTDYRDFVRSAARKLAASQYALDELHAIFGRKNYHGG